MTDEEKGIGNVEGLDEAKTPDDPKSEPTLPLVITQASQVPPTDIEPEVRSESAPSDSPVETQKSAGAPEQESTSHPFIFDEEDALAKFPDEHADRIIEDAWEVSRAMPRLMRTHRFSVDKQRLWEISDETNGLRGQLRKSRDAVDLSALRRQTVRLEALAAQHLGYRRRTALQDFGETLLVAILVAIFIRTFLFEAFRIPTPSMVPTLLVGDQIFVAKFVYGIRIPFTQTRIFEWRAPQRGEVIVFQYPYRGDNLGKDFIKRVIATGGDTVRVQDNVVLVNGAPLGDVTVAARRTQCSLEPGEECTYRELSSSQSADGMLQAASGCLCMQLRNETDTALWWTQHIAPDTACRCRMSRAERNHADWPTQRSLSTFNYGWGPDGARPYQVPLPGGGYEMQVPEGYLFVMGDNRDQSDDSRSWGLVPLDRVLGKAMVIWWSTPGQRDDRLFTLVH